MLLTSSALLAILPSRSNRTRGSLPTGPTRRTLPSLGDKRTYGYKINNVVYICMGLPVMQPSWISFFKSIYTLVCRQLHLL